MNTKKDAAATANTDAKISDQPTDSNSQDEMQPAFALQRVFIAESKIVSPNTPHIFKKAWDPKITMKLDSGSNAIEKNVYLSKLTLEVSGAIEEMEAFNLLVTMGGIFGISGIKDDILSRTLGVLCPSILFPYVRENIDGLMIKCSFPPLMLAPIDFEMIYSEGLKRSQEKQDNSLSQEGDYRPKVS